MGCRILFGNGGACFYDSVTNTVFGKLLDSKEEAEEFQYWVGIDLRTITDDEFENLLIKFREGEED
jgi:hypothetical protein